MEMEWRIKVNGAADEQRGRNEGRGVEWNGRESELEKL